MPPAGARAWPLDPHGVGLADVDGAPLLRGDLAERLATDALTNRERRAGPMQHLALIGDPGAGKTFLLHAFARRIAASSAPPRVLLLPEELPHIQSPGAFLAEILERLGGGPAAPETAWETLAGRIDRLVAADGREALLVLCLENFNELVRRAFPEHADQTLLRNWLDRSESRVMLIATSDDGRIDAEPSAPLFGFVDAIELTPLPPSAVSALFEAIAGGFERVSDRTLLETLFRLSDGSAHAANALGAAFARHGPARLTAILADILFAYAPSHAASIGALGSRASLCLRHMILEGEPVSQTELAARLGYPNQSAVAQPFKEMRQKGLLQETPDPRSRAKLAAIRDRYLACAYRQRALRTPPGKDILFWAVSGVAAALAVRKESPMADLRAASRLYESDGRAAAFRAIAELLERIAVGADALAFALAAEIDKPDLLSDLLDSYPDRLAGTEDFPAALLRAAIAFHQRGGDEDALVDLAPELQTVLRAFWSVSTAPT